MDVFGSFTLLVAFVCAVYAFVGGIAAIITRHPLLVKSTRHAGMATCVLIFIATFSLEYLLFSDNFSQAYVVSHSNRDLSAFYKVAALWSGQEGSLLFWTWLLSIYSALVVIMNLRRNRQLMPYVVSILMGTGVFFSILINFVANPFSQLVLAGSSTRAFAPPDGNGLNPALQYPSMVIHPPMLYLGYVGMVVPFAFAMSALITRQLVA